MTITSSKPLSSVSLARTVYSLEKRVTEKEKTPARSAWKRYAICGKRTLLEQIRKGQEHPKQWRIRQVNARCDAQLPAFLLKNAG